MNYLWWLLILWIVLMIVYGAFNFAKLKMYVQMAWKVGGDMGDRDNARLKNFFKKKEVSTEVQNGRD